MVVLFRFRPSVHESSSTRGSLAASKRVSEVDSNYGCMSLCARQFESPNVSPSNRRTESSKLEGPISRVPIRCELKSFSDNVCGLTNLSHSSFELIQSPTCENKHSNLGFHTEVDDFDLFGGSMEFVEDLVPSSPV
ncbi:hypothetical protein D915_008622 [Fasciola hepatica]|uniref:Uncharacterized protein n=1 Tax=Fasciola hepatica TaxID=6192 RepID=A0A4E0R256_FASHE|nr:hypothetical protein D915_008622 [Fasciola hepatica]